MVKRHALRKVTLFTTGVALCIAFVVFQMKYRVSDTVKQLGVVNKEILNMQETVQVLKAEWHYLNKPERLSHLNQKFLKLAPAKVTQVASLASFNKQSSSKVTMYASLN